jgi:hypothetical protein
MVFLFCQKVSTWLTKISSPVLLQVQSTASQVSNIASETFGVAKNVVGQVVDTVKPAVNAAIPYVKQSADAVYRTVFPLATDLEQQAEKALQSSGVDTKPVLEAAKVP